MPFADELLGAEQAQHLTRAVRAAYPSTDAAALAQASESLSPLALRARSDLLREALLLDVPGDYATLATAVRAAAADTSFAGWLIWPVTSAVAARAAAEATPAALDDALTLLAELTGRLTSEFAIRTLLRADLDRSLRHALAWTRSSDPAVRRLASEGTRPYLPWAVRVPALTAQPARTVPILDALYRDTDEAVRRSVANHLNDLSREHPELVIAAATRWMEAPDTSTASTVRHALRTLVKRGDPAALSLLGFAAEALEIEAPVLDRRVVPFGGSIGFTAIVRNAGRTRARVAIDYVVFHRKANGTHTTKTFKICTRELEPGEGAAVSRAHSFREITTRRYYPGTHAIALQVNGTRSEPREFELGPGAHSPNR